MTTAAPARPRLAARFGLAAVLGLAVALLYAGLSLQPQAEASAGNLARALPFGFAFGAGLVASVNPCGFFMLPSFVSFYVGADAAEPKSVARRLAAVPFVTVLATAGFVAVMTPAAIVISAGNRQLSELFPVIGTVVGVSVLALGTFLLASGRSLRLPFAPHLRSAAPARTARSVFLFGVAYGLTSLGCTLPIFIVVAGTASASPSLGESVARIAAYGLGVGATILAVTLGAALLQATVARWLRALVPHTARVSAAFLIVAGAYLAYYWQFGAGSLT